MNIKHYNTCSVRYSCISMFHQLYLYCLIFMYINVSPFMCVVFDIHLSGEILKYMHIKHYKYNWWNIDIHEYKTRHAQLVKHWYRWISNTTHINGETLIYMNIKQYKYNWWNIDIHNISPVILVVFDIPVYQYLTSYTCSVRYSCISMFRQLYLYCLICITGETLIYMNIKHYKYKWWNIDIQLTLVVSNSVDSNFRLSRIFIEVDMHVYQYLTSYTCSVWYSCISISHQLYV
jgi:hypothetical protein